MKLKLIFLSTIFILVKLSTGQLIDNRNCAAFTDEPFFYQEFIADNKIKSILGSISTKKDLSVIQETKHFKEYRFDEKGRQINFITTIRNQTISDTTFVYFIYDENDNLVVRRTSDSYGYYSYHYDYNAQGRKTKKKYCREENLGKNKNNFVLGKQYVIIKESYNHRVLNDSVRETEVLNTHDRVYMRITHYYDENNLLKKEEQKYLISKKKSITLYRYNDLGQVIEKKFLPNHREQKDFEKYTYAYDDLGNLEEINYYKKDKLILHKEIIYDPSSLLMKAQIIQEIESNFITIIKYKVNFY